ncbi:MAG: hypothetical protein HQL29_01270 [Candidatus Omnitrophica bacterium]|nr:hypothetical protein [Candidatus Omnitrophota bacterium]
MSPNFDKLLDLLQTSFPLVPEPFKEIALMLDSSEETILSAISSLKTKGVIRRIGPVFDAESLGYTSALFGVKVPLEKEEESADFISTFEGVTHNYHRDDEINLWFTLTSKTENEMEQIIQQIKTKIDPQKLLRLRSKKVFKIRAVFGLSRAEILRPLQSLRMTEDFSILKAIQNDLPLINRPFKGFAETLDMSEVDLLSYITESINNGYIRRYGALLGHRQAGYNYNVMVVFNIPSDKINEIGTKVSEKLFVSHCYERELCADWPFNFYAMVHAKSEEESALFINELKTIVGSVQSKTLKSGKEYKKSSLKIL